MNTIVIRPLVTEKSVENQKKGSYTFEVGLKARKNEIKSEIERMFNVHITRINTVVMHGKTRRVGKKRTALKLSDWKKAFISLKTGEQIDVLAIQ